VTGTSASGEQLRIDRDTASRRGRVTAGIARIFARPRDDSGYGKLFDLEGFPPVYRPYVEGIPRRSRIAGAGGDELPNFARRSAAHAGPCRHGADLRSAADEIRGDTAALGGDVQVMGNSGNRWTATRCCSGRPFSNLLRNPLRLCRALRFLTRRDSRERGSVATRRPNRRQRQRPRHCPVVSRPGLRPFTRPNATARGWARGSCRRFRVSQRPGDAGSALAAAQACRWTLAARVTAAHLSQIDDHRA